MEIREPITTAEQLKQLDDDEMLAGYNDGFAGEPEPGNNRSLSFWHGWRNGHADRMSCPDVYQLKLAKDIMKSK